jgi:hypothetical protein
MLIGSKSLKNAKPNPQPYRASHTLSQLLVVLKVWSQKKDLITCSLVPTFLETLYNPVLNLEIRLYHGPDWTGPRNYILVWFQNLGPDCLQISLV